MELHLRERLRTVDLSGDLADRRAGCKKKPAHLKGSGCGVAMLEGRGVHDHARCKGRREPPLINGEVCSERQRNEADHFTGSCGARINPSERPGCLVGNMVINQDAWR